jgi:hypothetical protein
MDDYRQFHRQQTPEHFVERADIRAKRLTAVADAPRGVLLLWNDAGAVAIAFDVDALSNAQSRVARLRHGYQHAVRGPHDDLLSWLRLIMLLLNLIAGQRAAYGAEHHRDIASGATADQAADAETGQPAHDSADALVVIARDLHRRDLFDRSAADLHFTGLRSGRRAGSQEQRKDDRDNAELSHISTSYLNCMFYLGADCHCSTVNADTLTGSIEQA